MKGYKMKLLKFVKIVTLSILMVFVVSRQAQGMFDQFPDDVLLEILKYKIESELTQSINNADTPEAKLAVIYNAFDKKVLASNNFFIINRRFANVRNHPHIKQTIITAIVNAIKNSNVDLSNLFVKMALNLKYKSILNILMANLNFNRQAIVKMVILGLTIPEIFIINNNFQAFSYLLATENKSIGVYYLNRLLDTAAKYNRFDMVKFLLQRGADPRKSTDLLGQMNTFTPEIQDLLKTFIAGLNSESNSSSSSNREFEW
jgi:hypothetical protein